MRRFEQELMVPLEDIEFALIGMPELPWADFLLNPRRLRGSDFLMRWSQGQWSEHRIVEAINATDAFFALPYGPSSVAPSDDVRAFELYFERLEAAGLGALKRPDLLVFQRSDEGIVKEAVAGMGGEAELPFLREDVPAMRVLLRHAVMAIECENSLWVAKMMPDYERQMKPMRRLGGALGLRKGAVLPTVIIKEEDREPLRAWQAGAGVPIHVWQVFYDMAFGVALDEAERLFHTGLIEATQQTFQAPGGPTTSKPIYKIFHHYTYRVGASTEEPGLVAAHLVDKNGHVLPYVRFNGGALRLDAAAAAILSEAAEARSESP
jgi:hypothetical protein